MASRDCLITLSGNHDDDSHAPNAMAEHSTILSAKGCCSLHTDILPKDRDGLAPSCLPETSSPAGSIFPSFQGVETECRESNMQIMSPGNSATRCAKKHDSLVAKLSPTVHEGLLKTPSGKSASPVVEACNLPSPATESPGCASLAPSRASRGHGSSASGFPAGSEGCESIVPSLTLENSESTGMKRFSSKPRMTFEGQEFLSLGIASQGPALHSVKGPDDIKSIPIPPVHAPGRGHSPLKTTEACDSLSLTLMLKGHDPPASREEPERLESSTAVMMPQSHAHQTQDAATQVHSAPTSIIVEPLFVNSHVIQAADILVALSALPEKNGH